jgi:hypothetical protein
MSRSTRSRSLLSPLTRRSLLKRSAVAGGALAAGPLVSGRARAQAQGPGKLLFVVAAGGGASVLDSFLPVLSTEGSGGNTWAAAQIDQPSGSNLRCPKLLDNSVQGQVGLGPKYAQTNFLSKHYADTVVMTQECTSVNHNVAAERSITGNNINKGRTIGEAMALAHGEGLVLPHVNMSGGGYAIDGIDLIPDWARAEPVADPRLFAFSTHGFKGVKDAPSASMMSRARAARASFEAASGFSMTFRDAPLLQRFVRQRDTASAGIESADLITKLMLFQSGADVSLSEYDLASSPFGPALAERFPNMAYDTWESQAALAFLLTRYGFSCSIVLGTGSAPIFKQYAPTDPAPQYNAGRMFTAPIGFDWSHNDHRGGQNGMWSRILKTLDALIDLLKAEPHLGDESQGAMWDRSLIYIATEFGRDKVSAGGSGHHLNNGNVLISPLLNGNRVYGGVDPDTCLTYGFDPVTGDPAPGTVMREQHVYSAVCHALDVDFDERIDMPCMVRAA